MGRHIGQTLRDAIEVAGFRVAERSVRLLPERAPRLAAAAAARLYFDLGGRHTRIALGNLEVAFPERDPAWRRRIGRESLACFARGLVDALRAADWDEAELRQRVRLDGVEHLEKVRAGGAGFFALTPHMGSFELAIRAAPAHGIPITVIGRPIRNERVRRAFDAERTRTGAELILHRNVAPRMLRAVREGRGVVVMNDQFARPNGGAIRVPFFGARAWTSPGLATLALRSGAAVLPAYMLQEPEGRHRLVFREPLRFTPGGDVKRDAAEVTTRLNAVLEEVIRAHPEQYMWTSRRFKYSPDVRHDLYERRAR